MFDLDFADDFVLMGTANIRLQKDTEELRKIAEEVGLRFNKEK